MEQLRTAPILARGRRRLSATNKPQAPGSNIRAAGHALRKHRRLDLNLTLTSGAPRPYIRGISPHASSGGTLRSVPSFAKATEGTHLAFIHGFTPVAFCEGG